MRLDPGALPVRFLRRENRFRVRVRVEGGFEGGARAGEEPGGEVAAYLPNTGRLGELLRPGARGWILPARAGARARGGPLRRTAWDMVLIERPTGDGWVGLDTRWPGRLLEEGWGAGRLPELRGCRRLVPEARHGEHRFDWLGLPEEAPAGESPAEEGGAPATWIECKAVSLVVGGAALFPDAPTERGRRQLEALRRRVEAGDRAACYFIVLREDARLFRPHADHDPAFAEALRRALAAGVLVRCWAARVGPREVTLASELPVELEPPAPGV